MKNLFKFVFVITMLLAPINSFADLYNPEFDKMQNLRCDIEETVYKSDGSVASKVKVFKNFKLDDEYNKIYLQKEPIDYVTAYSKESVEFNLQTMTDDSIVQSSVKINRLTNEYTSESLIMYDNISFGEASAKAVGICKTL